MCIAPEPEFERILQEIRDASFRKTLAQLGERLCRTPEELKAWSQSLGHEDVMTTLRSYGEVPSTRQAEIIKNLRQPSDTDMDAAAALKAVEAIIRRTTSRVATAQTLPAEETG
jgi:hypothetical protein